MQHTHRQQQHINTKITDIRRFGPRFWWTSFLFALFLFTSLFSPGLCFARAFVDTFLFTKPRCPGSRKSRSGETQQILLWRAHEVHRYSSPMSGWIPHELLKHLPSKRHAEKQQRRPKTKQHRPKTQAEDRPKTKQEQQHQHQYRKTTRRNRFTCISIRGLIVGQLRPRSLLNPQASPKNTQDNTHTTETPQIRQTAATGKQTR